MTDVKPITRDDLTVVHGTAEFGPTAKVTVNAGPLEGRIFTLKSTEKMPTDSAHRVDLRNGGGIHIHSGDPDEGGSIDWRGVFRTFDMAVAVNRLVDYINDLAEREALENALWGVMSELNDALEAFRDGLGESSRRDWREEWVRAQDAFAAVRLQAAEFGEAR